VPAIPPGRLLVVIVSGGALNATVAVADFVVSAALVAVTVTELEPETVAGAVYSPLAEIVPIDGFSVHVTAVFPVLATEAVNC
jgi:hypothetical protein